MDHRRFQRNSAGANHIPNGMTALNNTNSRDLKEVVGRIAETGSCTLCQKNAVCVCERCGDYYCSPVCQRQDWQSHRYICFPMPSLVSVSAYSGGVSLSAAEVPILTVSSANNIKKECQPQSPNTIDMKEKFNAMSNRDTQKQLQSIPTTPIPKSSSRVLITGFRSANRCFVRSLSPEDNDAFVLNLKKIENFGRTAPQLNAVPKALSFVLALFNGIISRAQVLSARNAKAIRLLFCDYGRTAMRQLSELREIPNDALALKQYSVMVQLRNVANYPVNDKLLKSLNMFEEKDYEIRYKANDGNEVELYIWQTKELLNNKINELCMGSPSVRVDGNASHNQKTDQKVSSTDKNTVEKLTNSQNDNKHSDNLNNNNNQEHTTKDNLIKSPQNHTVGVPFRTCCPFRENSTNVRVIVLDNSCLHLGYIGCLAETDLTNLATVHAFLATYKDTNKSYNPKLHEFCIAKFENEWYRGKVVEIQGPDQYGVVYIDYTNVSTVTSKDIRPYPAELALDCRTCLCLIDGLPSDLSEDHIKFLQNEVAAQSKLVIDRVKEILEIDQQIVLIECNNIIKKMHENVSN